MKQNILITALALTAFTGSIVAALADRASPAKASPEVAAKAAAASRTQKAEPAPRSSRSTRSSRSAGSTRSSRSAGSTQSSRSAGSTRSSRSAGSAASKRSTRSADPSASDAFSAERTRAKKAVASLTTTQKSKLLVLLNDGSTEDLLAIRGIGQSRAEAMAGARPFTGIDELLAVQGIGESVFADIIEHGRSLTARRSASSSSSRAGAKRSGATKRSSGSSKAS